jgi:Uma2 family endonuclease
MDQKNRGCAYTAERWWTSKADGPFNRLAFPRASRYHGGMKAVADAAMNRDGRFTYGDYRIWDDGERWELIGGHAWCMSPAPRTRHQELLLLLARKVGDFLERKPCKAFLAPFDVILPEEDESDDEVDTVVQPDLSVFCDRSKITEAGARGAPDFIIEILSPSTAKKDLGDKFALYERHGVREYWVVDPDARVVHAWSLGEDGKYGRERLSKKGEGIASTAIEGFSVDSGELFAED